MKPSILVLIAVATVAIVLVIYFRGFGSVQETAGDGQSTSFHDLKTRTLEGDTVELADWRGTVALVVNLASKCGLTPQYETLEALHRELAPRGFTVLGFPSNDFMGQEPGTAGEIREFCSTTYGVTFPIFEKVKVKGDDKCEVYRLLTAELKEPDWNFTKYLVDHEGTVIARFGPRVTPDDPTLRAKIEALLAVVPE